MQECKSHFDGDIVYIYIYIYIYYIYIYIYISHHLLFSFLGFCQTRLCGTFVQKHVSIHYNIPFTLIHAPLHHYSFTKHFLSGN